jgi:tryptophanyl-tRNA synthetase
MRILSGIQPTGALHIGNYFGMMRPAIELQEKGQCFYFIADYHALTSVQTPATLRQNVKNVALDFLACGLDPVRSAFFRQSDVPQVTELTWILSNVVPLSMLEKAHSYKDKIAKGISPNHGLFAYPVLMAADILLYQSNLVPVGQDQKQHLEMARDIAIKFNLKYGDVLTVPDALIRQEVAVIPGTDGQKMSKSYGNTIEIFGDEKTLRKKIMSIVMDSRSPQEPKPDAEKNLAVQLLKVIAPAVGREYEEKLRAGGLGYGDLKQKLFQTYWEYFAVFRTKRAALEKNPDYVEKVLQDGAVRARAEADKTMAKVRRAVGLA